ncbi:MAG: hypothetical protein P1Q69_20350, partial [Candidatus Thorarchaeota archaeon]|nr:hypothetical protein [Candidatus Thorarchaeota archaeon]
IYSMSRFVAILGGSCLPLHVWMGMLHFPKNPCRSVLESMKSDTELMSFGAEVYGLEPVFSASKWNAGGCG